MRYLIVFIMLSSAVFAAPKASKTPKASDLQRTAIAKIEEEKPAFFIKGDFLYWRIEEGELDFVHNDSTGLTSATGGLGDLEHATYEWNPGFKAALEYRIKSDMWKFEGHYTFFNPSSTKTILRPAGKTITGTFPQFTVNPMEKATSHISFQGHFFDLLLSRVFTVTPKIHINFFNGLEGCWIKQNWGITYFGEAPGNTNTKIKPKWRFKGVGIKSGLLADWLMGKGFNWTMQGAISEIFGNYDNRIKTIRQYPTTGVNLTLQFIHYDDFRLVTHFQFLMGPSWEGQYNWGGIRLFIGYELNNWLNIHEILREEFHASTDSVTNPLSRHIKSPFQTQGLTVNATLNW